MKKAALGILCLSLAAPLWAAPSVQLRLEVTPRDITIGDPIQYKLTVISSTDVTPAPLALPNPWGEFELLDSQSSALEKNPQQKMEQTHALTLTTFSTGTFSIPSLKLSFAASDGSQLTANSDPVEIKVASMLEKMEDKGGLRPLKGFYNFKSYFWLWLILGILAAAAFLWFYLDWRHKRRNANGGNLGPPKPAEETAWEALQKLEDSDLLANGQVKEFYSRLSNILRSYLETRFGISALERTSSELFTEFRKLNLPSDVHASLKLFFENGDLVKFAKFTPSDNEIDEDILRVKQAISQSTPEKTPKSQAAEEIPV